MMDTVVKSSQNLSLLYESRVGHLYFRSRCSLLRFRPVVELNCLIESLDEKALIRQFVGINELNVEWSRRPPDSPLWGGRQLPNLLFATNGRIVSEAMPNRNRKPRGRNSDRKSKNGANRS